MTFSDLILSLLVDPRGLVCLIVSIAAVVLALAKGLKYVRRSPLGLSPAHHELLHEIKSMTDEELRDAEQLYGMQRARHTPRFAEEHCPVCDIPSPTRCRPRIEAEERLYGLTTERRYRKGLPHLTEKNKEQDQ